ncbi:MAG: hypothetical protein V4478_01205 [Patescibacteria group bacterium]
MKIVMLIVLVAAVLTDAILVVLIITMQPQETKVDTNSGLMWPKRHIKSIEAFDKRKNQRVKLLWQSAVATVLSAATMLFI